MKRMKFGPNKYFLLYGTLYGTHNDLCNYVLSNKFTVCFLISLGQLFCRKFQNSKLDDERLYSLLLMMKCGVLKEGFCCMYSWHAIKTLF